MAKESSEQPNRVYWIVFSLGILYILLLGLFTYFFNYPI